MSIFEIIAEETVKRYGSADRTGISTVSEERCIEVMGYNMIEGSRVLAMMYEMNITERQGGLVVL